MARTLEEEVDPLPPSQAAVGGAGHRTLRSTRTRMRPGQDVEEQDDDHEDQGGQHQGRVVEGHGHHLAVVVGDEGRQRVAGIEQGAGHGRDVADDHEHGHGLAEGPREAEDGGRQDALGALAQDDMT